MRTGSDIDWDPEQGEFRLGNRVVAAATAGTRGEVRLHGLGGTVLRPLTFGERNVAVMYASGSPEPPTRLARSIREAALVTAGTEPIDPEQEVLETAVALFLAGAATEAPDFDTVSFLLGREGGWSLSDIANAVATEVDRLAIGLASRETPMPAEDGWHRIVLIDAAKDATSDDLDTLIAALAERLLSRYESEPVEPAGQDVDTWESEAVPHHEAWRQATTMPSRSAAGADFGDKAAGAAHSPVDMDSARSVRHPAGSATFARWRVLDPPGPTADWTMPTHSAAPPAMRSDAVESIDQFELITQQSAFDPGPTVGSPVAAGSVAVMEQLATPAVQSSRPVPNGRTGDTTVAMPTAADMGSRSRRLQNAVAPSRRFPGRADGIAPHAVTIGATRSEAPALGPSPSTPPPGFAPPDPTPTWQNARLPTATPTLPALSLWADELAQLLDEEADLRGLDP